jgi:arsenite-transporting ATPase
VLPDDVTLGARWSFVGGKGGVGKTTVAGALAVALAERGERVLALSIDPAHSLGDALATPLGAESAAVPGVPRLEAMELDAAAERTRFLDEYGAPLAEIVEQGTYLARADVDELLEPVLPGMDEVAAMLRLATLADDDADRRIVIDTAPTGHTLRLLTLPEAARGWLAAFDAMVAKRRAVAEAFTGAAPPPTPAAAALERLRGAVERFAALLADPIAARFLVVTTPEPTVDAETRRLLARLRSEHVAVGGVIVNHFDPSAGAAPPDFGAVPVIVVPELPGALTGPQALRAFAAAAQCVGAASVARAHQESPLSAIPVAGVRIGGPYLPPLDRTLYVVGGKGGVGKSTVAAALAVTLADAHGGTVLLSTDPAGSLGDLFGVAVGEAAAAVPGAPGLTLRQVDAAAAWDAFRSDYHAEMEALFTAGASSNEADRAVAERLLELAPPGIDELMALADVIDLGGAAAYNALVLDTAPTGHLLRLLAMPAVALDWTHALMRLLLRYREVIGLGETAERLLELARRLRALQARLADADRTLPLVVARPDALGVAESERLVPQLAALGLPAPVLLVNRLFAPDGTVPAARRAAAAQLLAIGGVMERASAPELASGPVGTQALRGFAGLWRRAEPAGRSIEALL